VDWLSVAERDVQIPKFVHLFLQGFARTSMNMVSTLDSDHIGRAEAAHHQEAQDSTRKK
jgi:hypothetical protein